MNVVDSSGWLEYFGKGPAGEYFAPVIRDSFHLVVPTISIYEIFKRILIQRDEEEALSAIGWMAVGLVVDLTQEIALSAALLSVELKLPMADSIILATTQTYQATLWTQDKHFKDFPGVEYIEKK
jgi:predicted nucleic acid-binding protein